MTENQTTPSTPEVQVTTPVTQTTSTTQSTNTINVDLFGVTVDLPIEKAKALIASRDERTRQFKDLSAKVAEAEAKAKNESERASLIEKMKAGDIDQVKAEASKEYKTKLENLQSKVIDTAIKAEMSSLPGFNQEYLTDALQLFKLNNQVSLNDKEEIVSNGKTLKETIIEFSKSKDVFFGKKVSSTGIPPTKLGVNSKAGTNSTYKNPFDAIKAGLEGSIFNK